MSFDKKQYWKRRKAGKRGEEVPERKVTRLSGDNRKNRRIKHVARYYEGEEDEQGHKYTLPPTKKGKVPHKDGYKKPTPTLPPLSNRDRFNIRKEERKARWLEQKQAEKQPPKRTKRNTETTSTLKSAAKVAG